MKTQEDFKEESVPERVQIVRFHHYNQKRMKHLEIIDQFFKQEDSKGEGIHSVLSSKGIPVPLQVPESLKAS